MATLTWGDVGTRKYETGLDRGVLYVDDVGYSWSGLVSVDENPSGGEVESYYIDGVLYMNTPGIEDFEASLSAYYSPEQFDVCEGIGVSQPGFRAAQQRRKSFGLSYRTRIGNDTEATSYGYKIHLIYNAVVAPPKRGYKTVGEKIDPTLLTWDFKTKPVAVPNLIRSAHIIIDSTTAPAFGLIELESILYGTSEADPRLPTPEEISGMFEGTSEFTVTDLGGGFWRISGSSIEVAIIDDGVYQITSDGVVAIDSDTFEITGA